MKDNLGDRIKDYENITRHYLVKKMPVVIRVDGKSFHTLTKNFDKPYDMAFIDAMQQCAVNVAQKMMGFKVGYVASDEVTFILTDYDRIETQAWFGNNLNKLVSISAAMMTAEFCNYYNGIFDSRAFNVPKEDVLNVLLWRAKDWQRNSLRMFAGAHFSHKELQGKNSVDMHEMLHTIGLNWTTDIHPICKNGTFLFKNDDGKISTTAHILAKYENLNNKFGKYFK